MNKYKVFGDKVVDYYINVEAISAEEAWDIASNAATTDWIQMETDNTIQVHFVDNELEDTSNLLEDGYPSINNDIVISDKSDI
jgi:aspartyl/asparaginyl beta-hydroxylase (cupin superfamily)